MSRAAAILDVSTLRLAPVDPLQPATGQIARELQAAILSMRLPPGRMLSENEVGHAFQASRTPVREAFTNLREMGLIETRPSRGTFVSMLSEAQTRSAQFLREALETSVARHLCETGIPEMSRTALGENLSQQAEAIAADDKQAFQTLDDRFHSLLAEATGFDRLAVVLAREKTALDRLRVLSLNDANHMARLLAEHEAIVSAITEGNTAEAVLQTRNHVRSVLDLLSTLAASHQEYFKPE